MQGIVLVVVVVKVVVEVVEVAAVLPSMHVEMDNRPDGQ